MTHQKKQALNRRFRLMPWPWLCGLLGLALVSAALAADPLYENDAVLNFTVPPGLLPAVDATNFLNNNWFQVAFTSTKGGLNGNAELYETEDTVNYTNIGTMVATSSILTNGSSLILSFNPGCGFNFDTYNTDSGLEQMAGSFYNPGSIRANSQIDLAQQFLLVSTVGKCLVNATNIIINPGTIELGLDSLIQLTGQNVDLTRGTLVVEGGLGSVFGAGGFGVDTNAEWNPGIDLALTGATPSLVRIGNTVPAFWTLPPGYPTYQFLNFPVQFPVLTTPYVSVTQVATNSIIYRYVFVTNTIPNVTANVYIDPVFTGLGLGVVEFVGSYKDPVTDLPANDFLYLVDDYLLGANNPGIGANGVPNNFSVITSATSLVAGTPPDAPGFLPLPNGAISNAYSFVNAQLGLLTNNPSPLNVTNYLSQVLPGRIQISADSNLDLSLAQISGQNYLSLRAPNQFNGSTGARISSPYSDINLGVTNGFMTVTNLIEPYLPGWNGPIQAWSTRFVELSVVTNVTAISTNIFTVTNDYRVLIVANEAAPTTLAEIQDLKFHDTNLVISDALNLLRSVSIDAQNLTLTTNGPGSVSPEGQLNLQLLPTTPTAPVNYAFVWSNAFPNLHNFTNSGAFSMPNVNPVNLGSSASPLGAFINHGSFADQGVIICATNFESDGWFSNSVLGSFVLQSQTTTLTNGLLTAGGDVSITTGGLLTSNLVLLAGRSLKLIATNLLTDTGVTNGNVWTVGAASIGSGLSLPLLPVGGGGAYGNSLLGTTITLFAPNNKNVVNTWAAGDFGASNVGYTNNVAIGHLVLNALSNAPNTQLYFSGTGASNAIYVDRLELAGFASYIYHNSGGNLPALAFNTNLVIYYADCIDDNVGEVSELINGKNGNHLRWVPTYAGYFSSTNLVHLGQTNAFNVALAESHDIDSNGNGIANAFDPTPFFLTSMTGPVAISNTLSGLWAISWNSIPNATNVVFYSTNSTGPFTNLLVNFSTNSSGPFTMSNFISPIPYPSPPARVMIFTPILVSPPSLYYMPVVNPWTTYPY